MIDVKKYLHLFVYSVSTFWVQKLSEIKSPRWKMQNTDNKITKKQWNSRWLKKRKSSGNNTKCYGANTNMPKRQKWILQEWDLESESFQGLFLNIELEKPCKYGDYEHIKSLFYVVKTPKSQWVTECGKLPFHAEDACPVTEFCFGTNTNILERQKWIL